MRQGIIRYTSALIVLAGAWLAFSPLWVHYTSTANKWQQVVVGIVIALLGVSRMAAPSVRWPSWVNFLAGIWLIIAPWTMTSTTTVKWNEVVLGIIVAVLAAWGAIADVAPDAEMADQPGINTHQTAGGFYERIGRGRWRQH